MCILFAYINNEAKDGEYQLIIANNRDELYDRPTAPAARWKDDPSCIGGIDLCPYVPAGGTWLAVSTKTERIASLLNIVLPNGPDPTKKGRGCLVTKFITGSELGEDYLNSIQDHASEYNPFNLILFEKSPTTDRWVARCYSQDDPQSPHSISEQFIGISNSVYMQPWNKVQQGKALFKDIVTQYPKVTDREQLTSSLIELLSSRTSYLPDPDLEAKAARNLKVPVEVSNRARGAISVHLPQLRYGSRTNTIILVESSGRGQYIERTLEEPIDPDNPVWNTSCIDFQIGEKL